jgi:hypothetical protein
MESQLPTTSVEAVCHCGLVKITAPNPEKVTSCNCSICHAYGHICAYYSASELLIVGDTQTYVHGDGCIAFHRCANCGCVTHWIGIDPTSTSDRMAVNARLMPRSVLSQVRVRHFDGLDTWKFRDEEESFERRDINCNLKM